jgi:nicotinamidase-related amidase
VAGQTKKEKYVVEKFRYEFFNTNLEAILRANHVYQVLVTRTVTDVCVDSTAKAALNCQLRPIVVADAVSSTDADL